jgi:hypothetical protein
MLVSRCDEVETDDCIREHAGIALCELPASLIFVRHGDDDGAYYPYHRVARHFRPLRACCLFLTIASK